MPPGSREIAESCLDLLNIELVRSYSEQLKGRPELAGRRVEAIGFQVGQQLVERATKERPRFADHLEVIKFICKDLWSDVFKKQVDNLKTNHRGTFVLQDTRFRWLTRLSSDVPPPGTPVSPSDTPAARASAEAGAYLYFPCGLIRGALTNLGIPCTVSAEVNQLPACSFTIKIKP
ncbi:transport protein particle (TRAPP) component [Klebsormidium nitens]|uniref:Transport protein particle (TRAPP) component n=1 Tax=Klebsormidium nitens TaxID=105231 RepID=A0A1Y1IG54_KLENI|nr:transport protein particle (TRAPP) component [Klebsormidium nitens]|eukprot:GAQ89824.1 transport protein particle (TRAPP) component [Klebsormidium nitens]